MMTRERIFWIYAITMVTVGTAYATPPSQFFYLVREDLIIPAVATRLGPTAPDFAKFQDNGAGSVGVYEIAFDGGGARDEEVFFSVEMSHSWAEGTDLSFHVHWALDTADSCNVRWCIEYTMVNVAGGAFPATTIQCSDVASPGVAKQTKISNIYTLPGAGFTTSAQMLARVYRNATHANDTCNGIDAWAFDFDFHVTLDKRGEGI